MSRNWIFIPGLALLVVLSVIVGLRLRPEYRNRLRPSFPTVCLVVTLYTIHFGLLMLAAIWSTWSFSLPLSIAVGGGTALVVVGTAVYLNALYVFGFKRQWGADTTRLVTEGIYRWSRNPLFLGWTLILVGIALIRGSAMVLLLTLFFWISYRLSLPLEEELLGRLYGEDYETYRRRTHRYFGSPKEHAAR